MVVNQPPIVVGSAVTENISTEDMVPGMPLVHGQRLGRDISFQMAETVSGRGQVMRFVLNAAFGAVLPAFALYVHHAHGDKPCDKPIGPWLSTYGWLGLALGNIALFVNIRMLMIQPIMQAAAAIEDERERAAAMAPALPTLSSVGCFSCCCLLPLSIFLFFWWIKGQFDVWGTYPREHISWDEPVAIFAGCDAQLLGGARALMLLTYVMILGSVCSACCMCAVAIVAVARAAEEQQAQQQGARGRDMV